MIVVLKHLKKGNMIYISHVDLIRHFTRAFRRAGADIEFSDGFNPHMLLNLGTPLPLGMKSAAEYLTVRANVSSAEELLERYNAAAPAGLEAVKAFQPLINPNIAGKTAAADYFVPATGILEKKEEIEKIAELSSLEMPVTKKGETKLKEIASLVHKIEVRSGGLFFRLAAGNTTLRADAFAAFLADKIGFTVRVEELEKREQYVAADGEFMMTDDYLKNLESGSNAEEAK